VRVDLDLKIPHTHGGNCRENKGGHMKRLALLGITSLLILACGGGTSVLPSETVDATAAPATGVITFGSGVDPDDLTILTPAESFPVNIEEISYSASLSESAGATSLTIIIASVTDGGAESFIYQEDLPISNPTFGIFANTADLALIVDNAPGRYVMRFMREATVLAEGFFTLE
jgi:hypothetical protein